MQVSFPGLSIGMQDLYTDVALHVLFDYLQITAVSPLQADFVQLADPFWYGLFCLRTSV